MAFYSMLSRASSSVPPLAVRIVRSPRTFHGAACNFVSTEKSNLSHELTPRSRLSFLQFSTETEATKQSAGENLIRCVRKPKIQRPMEPDDQNLICVLESKIQRAKESDDHNFLQEMTDEFPFKIQRNPQSSTSLLLTRKWRDETIEVEGYIPNINEVCDDYENDDEDGNENDEDGNPKGACYDTRIFQLDVSVSKKQNGLKLNFGITAFQNKISIDHLWITSFKCPDGSEVAYNGPKSSNLDLDSDQVEQAFVRYLEVRGIKPSIANFLPKCVDKKGSREHYKWLKNLKNFIEH